MEKRIIIACDTPLQVLNAINLKENHFGEYSADIYIYNQFRGAKNIVERLQETCIFKNVYLVKKYRQYPVCIQKLATLKRMLFPYATLKKYIENGKKIHKCPYEYVMFSFITTFSVTIFGMAKATRFILIEDGIGTYVGDILNDYTSGTFKKIISNTIYKKIDKPDKVAIYSTEMYNGNIPCLKLEKEFSKQTSQKIEYVYDYKINDLYRSNKFVYLTQPFQEAKGYDNQSYMLIDKVLKKYKEDLMLRVHPRQKEDVYKDFVIDTFKNLWELECIHQIDDNNVLIGIFSTAQLMPKVLADKEPYLIFLYKLVFEERTNENWNDWAWLIDLFKGFYRNSQKIFIPQNIEEFEQMLSDILKKENFYE